MYHASFDLLKEDKRYLVAEQCLELVASLKTNRFRRARLLEACSKRVKALKLGVSFNPNTLDKIIEAFQGDELTPDDQKLLEVKNIPVAEGSPKHDSFIVPNVDRLKAFLESASLNSSNATHEDLTVEKRYRKSPIDEKLIENEWRMAIKTQIERDNSPRTLIKLKTRKDHSFMVDAIADIQSHVRPSRWKVSVFHNENNNFLFDKDAMRDLASFIETYLIRNAYPFKFVIEYLGPFAGEDPIRGEILGRSNEKKVKHFILWASMFHKHFVTSEERTKIQAWLNLGQIEREQNIPHPILKGVSERTVNLLGEFSSREMEYLKLAIKYKGPYPEYR